MRSNTSDRRMEFRTAWVAAFLGLLLIIGAIFWAMFAFGNSG
jgi:hypothetical protein